MKVTCRRSAMLPHFFINEQPKQAHLLLKASFHIRMYTKGFGHDDTLLSAHKLTIALSALGQNREAKLLAKRTFRQRRRLYGFGHILTLRAGGALAGILYATGERRKALALQRKIYEKSRQINGEVHEQTRIARHNLCDMERFV